GKRVLAGTEGVAELPEIDELRDLGFAHDQLRTALDLLVLVGKAVGERVARIIGPLDDVDELLADEIEDRHGGSVVCRNGFLARRGKLFRFRFALIYLFLDARERNRAGNRRPVREHERWRGADVETLTKRHGFRDRRRTISRVVGKLAARKELVPCLPPILG